MIRTVAQLREALAVFPDDMHLTEPVKVVACNAGIYDNRKDPYFTSDGRRGWLRTCRIGEIDTEPPNLDWRMPPPPEGARPVAQSYGEGWDLWMSPRDGEADDFDPTAAIEWPFKDEEATADDMIALGFEVI